jgi:hypothetical protein
MNELTLSEPMGLAPAEQTIRVANLLEMAVEKGMDPTALEKLVALHERIMDREAESQFNAAMQAFQSECPVIGKTSVADTGRYKYTFASLDHVAESIRPYTDKHGFSYSFDSAIDANFVKVTCIVAHIGGHKRRNDFSAPIDTKAAMNDTQKYASAVSYGQRYALKLAFGLSFGDDDDAKQLHPNPEPKADAPKTETRGTRKSSPEGVTAKQVGDAVTEWKTFAKDDSFDAWKVFVLKETGRMFNPKQSTEWTLADLRAVHAAIQREQGVPQNDEIPF